MKRDHWPLLLRWHQGLLSFIMYNIQKYRVPKNSQCLKGSDYSLHDRSNSTPGKLHRRAQSLTSQGTELKTDQSDERMKGMSQPANRG